MGLNLSDVFSLRFWRTHKSAPEEPTHDDAVLAAKERREVYEFCRQVYKQTGVTADLRRTMDFFEEHYGGDGRHKDRLKSARNRAA